MIEKKNLLLLSFLVIILVYHYFDNPVQPQLNYNSNSNNKINITSHTESNNSASQSKQSVIFNESSNSEKYSSNQKELSSSDNNQISNDIKKLVEIYGEPTNVSDNTYNWDYMSQTPWNKIIYKKDSDFPYYYFITATISDLNEFEKWKNILPNLEFNPKRKSLVFNTKDEGTALAVANIVISNLQGKLSFEDILSKKLIPISINRTTHHDMIKHKIREQLTELVNKDWNSNKKTENLDYQEDIASTQTETNEAPVQKQIISNSPMAQNDSLPETNELNAYTGGSGFSFI